MKQLLDAEEEEGCLAVAVQKRDNYNAVDSSSGKLSLVSQRTITQPRPQ